MEKIIFLIIFMTQSFALAAELNLQLVKNDTVILLKNEVPLSTVISTFDVLPPTVTQENLQIQISNYNALTKTEILSQKTEEYEEYTRYSLNNPFLDAGKQKLDLYVFQKLKIDTIESKDSADFDLSDFGADVLVLLDPSTKKTLKSKVQIFYRERLIGEGVVDDNSNIKMIDNLSGKIKDGKINNLKITKSLLDTSKRSFDLEIQFSQNGKNVNQNLNINLLNIKQTPIVREDPVLDEELDNELDTEEIENETSTHHS